MDLVEELLIERIDSAIKSMASYDYTHKGIAQKYGYMGRRYKRFLRLYYKAASERGTVHTVNFHWKQIVVPVDFDLIPKE